MLMKERQSDIDCWNRTQDNGAQIPPSTWKRTRMGVAHLEHLAYLKDPTRVAIGGSNLTTHNNINIQNCSWEYNKGEFLPITSCWSASIIFFKMSFCALLLCCNWQCNCKHNSPKAQYLITVTMTHYEPFSDDIGIYGHNNEKSITAFFIFLVNQ